MTSLPLKAVFSWEEYKAAKKDKSGQPTLLNPPTDVMDPKLGQADFKERPAYVYLYRIVFGGDGQWGVEHMLHYEGSQSVKPEDRPRINHGDVPNIVQGLLDRTLPSRNPSNDLGANFKHEGKHWNRLCYLAFVIDHPNWSFCDLDSSPQLPPAVFRRYIGNKPTGKNMSFFDGAVVPILVGGEERKLFYCINHFRNKDGKWPPMPDRPHFKESFKYDLYTKFDFGSGNPAILIFDPGGDNKGPPVPPPDLP
ncbi:hypothetical protein [Parasphingorhabdus sp.]|uniref:hypothetical protein n=1 Tax=Parasphingorhabdus sp. TaxID=2709688 RepID=UPI003A921232